MPVIVDGDARVPWEQVLTIVNLAKREGVKNIEFAAIVIVAISVLPLVLEWWKHRKAHA